MEVTKENIMQHVLARVVLLYDTPLWKVEIFTPPVLLAKTMESSQLCGAT